ncbi:MAG: DUF2946 domain-containing protein [Azoarcus sp.]|jgi:hypothetical protein|nr:DUF2946 domain-containing protein [Azoarcus sp.]
MRFSLPGSPRPSIFRRQQRRLAWLAVLVLCLQLLAFGFGQVHAAKRQAMASLFAADICHTSFGLDAGTDENEAPASSTDADGHCPFCRPASANIMAPAPDALSFPSPEPTAFFVPAVDAGLQPSEPDSLHAPTRAPPPFPG